MPCPCIECGSPHCDETATCKYVCAGWHAEPVDKEPDTHWLDDDYDMQKDEQS